MSTHTALPWDVDGEGTHVCSVSKMWEVTAPCVPRMVRPDDDQVLADAAFIVRACNSHYDLLEALKAMVASYDGIRDTLTSGIVLDKLAKADAAIAKAEGK